MLELLRLATFNTRYGTAPDGPHSWEFRRESFFQTLENIDADILALQEPLQAQVKQIATRLPDYGWVGVGRDDGIAAGEFCPIFYRKTKVRPLDAGVFWLSDTPNVPGSITWDHDNVRICQWLKLQLVNGTEAIIFNAHLDNAVELARQHAAKLIIGMATSIGDEMPSLIVGDFNALPGDIAPGLVRAANYSDALESVYGIPFLQPTFHDFGLREPFGRIDYIFASPEWRFRAATIWTEWPNGTPPSDHYPVVADLELPKPPEGSGGAPLRR